MKKKEKDNRGFSLVEFIIVIAIMAVLVGIVGTRVIPYIDKAKKAKDIQIISSYCTDAEIAFVSCTDQIDTSKTYTIIVSKGDSGWKVDVKDSSEKECKVLKKEFTDINDLGTRDPNLQSKEGKKINKIIIVCKHGNLTSKLTVEGPENADAFAVEAK